MRQSMCTVVASAILLLAVVDCQAQEEPPPDHSCTVSAGGEFVLLPQGTEGRNFQKGGGFQAGVGFALKPLVEPPPGAKLGPRLFLTANFSYDRLNATPGALALANIASATAAHGSFSAATLDPTVRFPLSKRTSLYLSGGFGWFRRGVGFNSDNPGSLTQPNGHTLEKQATNSGAVDFGGGVNYGLSRQGGLMLYLEARVYRGLAVNSGTTLGLASLGVRW